MRTSGPHDLPLVPLRHVGTARAAGKQTPIVPLSSRHRGLIERHLLDLDPRDRYLRFGHAASDDTLKAFVARLDFARDAFFGLFDPHLKLVGLAQLASAAPNLTGAPVSSAVEFAVSVSPSARGRGHGRRLFDHAVRRAQSTGVERLLIHALSENAAMLHIACAAGATVSRHGSESEAWLELPPQSPRARWQVRALDRWATLIQGWRQQPRHAG